MYYGSDALRCMYLYKGIGTPPNRLYTHFMSLISFIHKLKSWNSLVTSTEFTTIQRADYSKLHSGRRAKNILISAPIVPYDQWISCHTSRPLYIYIDSTAETNPHFLVCILPINSRLARLWNTHLQTKTHTYIAFILFANAAKYDMYYELCTLEQLFVSNRYQRCLHDRHSVSYIVYLAMTRFAAHEHRRLKHVWIPPSLPFRCVCVFLNHNFPKVYEFPVSLFPLSISYLIVSCFL
jgi:hypothetical protein